MELPLEVMMAIREDYPPDERAIITALLSSCGPFPCERDRERVLIGILKLAKGDPGEVRELVARAHRDYRDIIFWAEYPEESRMDTPDKIDRMNEVLNRLGATWRAGEE